MTVQPLFARRTLVPPDAMPARPRPISPGSLYRKLASANELWKPMPANWLHPLDHPMHKLQPAPRGGCGGLLVDPFIFDGASSDAGSTGTSMAASSVVVGGNGGPQQRQQRHRHNKLPELSPLARVPAGTTASGVATDDGGSVPAAGGAGGGRKKLRPLCGGGGGGGGGRGALSADDADEEGDGGGRTGKQPRPAQPQQRCSQQGHRRKRGGASSNSSSAHRHHHRNLGGTAAVAASNVVAQWLKVAFLARLTASWERARARRQSENLSHCALTIQTGFRKMHAQRLRSHSTERQGGAVAARRKKCIAMNSHTRAMRKVQEDAANVCITFLLAVCVGGLHTFGC